MPQTHILEFTSLVKTFYIPIRKEYTATRGLSERQIRKRLEKNGYKVWRGGSIHIIRSEVYPNVLRKYTELILLLENHGYNVQFLQYLCEVHHGMPDFICYRDNKFKFVECKYKYEQLSSRQVRCISILLSRGFRVEIHKLVSNATKIRQATVNIHTGVKNVHELQTIVRKFR